MELFVFVSSTLLIWLLCRLLEFQSKATKLDFPSVRDFPLIGNLKLIQLVLSKTPLIDHQVLIERFPSFFKCWLFNFRFLCPHSPEAIRKILSAEECLSRPVFAKQMFSGFSGDTYHEWMQKRKFMNGLFWVSSLKDAVSSVESAADEFCSELAGEKCGEKHLDICSMIAKWTLKVHCTFLLGCDKESVEGMIHRMERFTSTRNDIAHFLVLPQIAKFLMPSKFSLMEAAKADLISFTRSLLSSQTTSEKTSKNAANYEKTLKSDDFGEQIISLMDAGYETVALTLTHVILFLALHRDVQEEAFEEIRASAGEISYETLQKSDLLERVIRETLRLAPPLPYLPREAHTDIEIEPGKVVERGTIILIPNYGVHRLKSIWGEDVDKFNPDNFLLENIARRHKTSAFSFSHGKRMCIGHRYAMIVMKILLTKLLEKFSFETDAKEELKFTAKVTLALDCEIELRVKKRVDQNF